MLNKANADRKLSSVLEMDLTFCRRKSIKALRRLKLITYAKILDRRLRKNQFESPPIFQSKVRY